MLAMVVNDNVGYLVPRGAWATIASMLAPTGWGSKRSIVENKFQKLRKRDIKPL